MAQSLVVSVTNRTSTKFVLALAENGELFTVTCNLARASGSAMGATIAQREFRTV